MSRKIYIIVFSLILFLTTALSMARLVGRESPKLFLRTPMVKEDVEHHGNDSILTLGDYILLYGTPTGEGLECWGNNLYSTTKCGTVDAWFGTVEVDMKADDFNPYSIVMYTNGDSDTPPSRWRGFTTQRLQP